MIGLYVVGCGGSTPRFTTKERQSSDLISSAHHQLEGVASYYADKFHGRTTANGEIFDMHSLTAAHRTLPFNTKLKVRNIENDKTVVVRINDRGPFKDNRVIDLSLKAAQRIDLIANGTARVELEIIELGLPAN
jgi:rare lipoprotein A